MKRFATSIPIRATPEAVWAILVDAAAYPGWNTTVERIDGAIVRGGTITVHARIAKGRAFPVRVTELDPPRRMVWTGGMPFGLFIGIRTFELSPRSDGTVEFAMRETFTGLLAPLITRAIPDLQPVFDAFAADLKRRAEAPG